jgi:hypothetical protein
VIAFCYIGAKGRVINLDQLVSAELTPHQDAVVITMTVGPMIRVEGTDGVALFCYLRRLGREVPRDRTLRLDPDNADAERGL